MAAEGGQTRADHLVPSVVVPNLDNARFLENTLRSIAAQNQPELDVVIVDGCSTDGSVEIIQSWAERHRWQWLSEPDSGQAEAINKGFRMARGDVVTWLNSDDLLADGAVNRIIHEFERDPALDFLWGLCVEIDAGGRPLRILNPTVTVALAGLRERRNFIPQPAAWYRRSLLDRFGLLDESYHYSFDYELFLRFAGRCNDRFLPQVLAEFRIHSASKTGSTALGFLREETRAFRAHGGRWASPFTLEILKSWIWAPLLSATTSPLRWIAHSLFRAQPHRQGGSP